jgi:hypothetical protein
MQKLKTSEALRLSVEIEFSIFGATVEVEFSVFGATVEIKLPTPFVDALPLPAAEGNNWMKINSRTKKVVKESRFFIFFVFGNFLEV